MKKLALILVLFIFTNNFFGQTTNEKLNQQLNEMKDYFLSEDYDSFTNYTYPKVVKMMGGKSKMASATKNAMDQMKKNGFSFLSISYKDASRFLKQANELQCSLTQQIMMKTPQGNIEAQYTLIAISSDEGQNWSFIDTSGKSKETMLNYFPNLSSEIIIKPKKQRIVD